MGKLDAATIKIMLDSGDDASVHKAIRDRLDRRGTLALSDLGLETLPDALGTFPTAINVLDLRKNKLKTLPASMSGLGSLQQLILTSNKWSGLPEVIFDLQRLNQIDGAPGHSRNPTKALLNNFLTHTQGIDGDHRRRLWQMMNDGTSDLPLSRLFEALRGNYPELHAAAVKALQSRSQGAPLDDKAVVAAIGNLSVKKGELQEALEARGVRYTRGISRDTTHIVLGRSPRNVDGVDDREFTFMTESEAEEIVRGQIASSKPLLGGEGPRAEAHAQNLSKMLLSDKEDTVELGLSLIKAQGMPPGAITAMFIVAKLSGNATHRANARKILKRQAPANVVEMLGNAGKIDYAGDKAEQKTAAALASCARQAPEIDWFVVARRLRKTTGYGLSFVIDRAPMELKVEVLRENINKDGHLDFHAVYSPHYSPQHTNSYAYYSPMSVPAVLYELTELKSLTMKEGRLSDFPAGLSRLTNLVSLDISGNMFSALPDELAQMPALRNLRVGGNTFTGFPEVLTKMTALEQLNIRGNRNPTQSHTYLGLEIPAEMRAAMPRCQFVDGLNEGQERHNSYYVR